MSKQTKLGLVILRLPFLSHQLRMPLRTGANKNNALVAVSAGLLNTMEKAEVGSPC